MVYVVGEKGEKSKRNKVREETGDTNGNRHDKAYYMKCLESLRVRDNRLQAHTIARRTWINTVSLRKGLRRKSKPSQAAETSVFVGMTEEVDLLVLDQQDLCAHSVMLFGFSGLCIICAPLRNLLVLATGRVGKCQWSSKQGRCKLILSSFQQ